MALFDEIRREVEVADGSPRELRQFGLGLGAGASVLAATLFWKHSAVWGIPGAVGVLLLLLAAFLPKWLLALWRVWMPLARLAGFFISRLLLVVLYYLALTPIALVMRLFRKDPLERQFGDRESYWKMRQDGEYRPEKTERMY